jgi:hypothetical protein
MRADEKQHNQGDIRQQRRTEMRNVKLPTTTAVVLSLTFGTMASIAMAQQPDNQTGHPETDMMMVENCNRMMESMTQMMPTAPAAPITPEPEKKG